MSMVLLMRRNYNSAMDRYDATPEKPRLSLSPYRYHISTLATPPAWTPPIGRFHARLVATASLGTPCVLRRRGAATVVRLPPETDQTRLL